MGVVRSINWDVIFFFSFTKITHNTHYGNYCGQHSTALCSYSYCPLQMWVKKLASFYNYHFSNGCIFLALRNENCNLKTPKTSIPVGFKRCSAVHHEDAQPYSSGGCRFTQIYDKVPCIWHHTVHSFQTWLLLFMQESAW